MNGSSISNGAHACYMYNLKCVTQHNQIKTTHKNMTVSRCLTPPSFCTVLRAYQHPSIKDLKAQIIW